MSKPYEGDSGDPKTPGIVGTYATLRTAGVGVLGAGVPGYGVVGYVGLDVPLGRLLPGEPGFPAPPGNNAGVFGFNPLATGPGVSGINNGGGQPGKGAPGVHGSSSNSDGVQGWSQSSQNAGVSGVNNSTAPAGKGGPGVYGSSNTLDGVQGWSGSSLNAGVAARNTAGGFGVWAQAQTAGYFDSTGGFAIQAVCAADIDTINARSNSPNHAAVSAANSSNGNGTLPSGFAVWAKSNATAIFGDGNPAGFFRGDVLVTGDLVLVNSSSGDIAEDFDVEDEQINVDPGTVLIINDQGKLCASSLPYDTRVAGVISGAGELKPAVVLQRISSPTPRSPIALLGKVFCKADATSGSIAAGDLLTTSGRRGYAMKVSDKSRALGAILGKALAPISNGIGIIPVLVTLR